MEQLLIRSGIAHEGQMLHPCACSLMVCAWTFICVTLGVQRRNAEPCAGLGASLKAQGAWIMQLPNCDDECVSLLQNSFAKYVASAVSRDRGRTHACKPQAHGARVDLAESRTC